MKSKKILSLCVLCASALMGLVACGGGSNSSSAAQSSESHVSESTQTSESSKETSSSVESVESSVSSESISVAQEAEIRTELNNVEISLSKEKYVVGETVEFTLTPDENFKISEVLANGTELTAVDGKYSFVALEKNKIEATAIAIIYKVSGTVKIGENNLTSEEASNLVLTAISGETKYDGVITYAETGTSFYVEVFGSKDIKLVLKAKTGTYDNVYDVLETDAFTVAADMENNLVIPVDRYGDYRVINLFDSASDMKHLDHPQAFNNELMGKIYGDFLYESTLGTKFNVVNDDLSLIDNITDGKDGNNLVNIETQMWCDEGSIRIQVLHWSTKWYVKMYVNDDAVDSEMTVNELQALQQGKLKALLERKGKHLTVYLQDAEGNIFKHLEKDETGTNPKVINWMDFAYENAGSTETAYKASIKNAKVSLKGTVENAVAISKCHKASIDISGDWKTENFWNQDKAPITGDYAFSTALKISNFLNDDGSVKTFSGIQAGFRFNVYNDSDAWGYVDALLVMVDGSYKLKLAIGPTSTNEFIDLTPEQLTKIGTNGLYISVISKDSKLNFYVDNALVKGDVANGGHHVYKYIDAIASFGDAACTMSLIRGQFFYGYSADLTLDQVLKLAK